EAHRALPSVARRRLRPSPLTRSPETHEDHVTRSRLRSIATRLLPLLALLAIALLLVACAVPAGAPEPGASGSPRVSPSASLPAAAIPLEPAPFTLNPFGFLAWIFTPLYQTFFILLVLLDKLFGNIAIAIIILTIGLRALLTPLYRRQITSSRRMQLLSPELKEIQRRYKG